MRTVFWWTLLFVLKEEVEEMKIEWRREIKNNSSLIRNHDYFDKYGENRKIFRNMKMCRTRKNSYKQKKGWWRRMGRFEMFFWWKTIGNSEKEWVEEEESQRREELGVFRRRVVCGFTRRVEAGVDWVGDGYVVDDSCVCYEIAEMTKSDFCEKWWWIMW